MNEFLEINSGNTGQSLKCLGTTKRGQPCKNTPLTGKKYCLHHLKRRRIKLTALLSIVIVVLGVLADWIEVSSYLGIDFIKKTSPNLSSVDAVSNSQQEIPLDGAPIVIQRLSRINNAKELMKFLHTYVKKGDIAVGNYSDFEDDRQGALYVIVVDEKNVLDIFRYKDFVFYDIHTSHFYRELRTKYKDRKKIWMLHLAD
jgi:hypothetical protein